RIRGEQAAGHLRTDVDAEAMGNGIVTILLSLLMSVVQVGTSVATIYGDDVSAVINAALDRTPRH
ncbi:MAG TPA: hypothetical protein VJM33_13915, partial [Microthrixaceae bacterium]|nr:hypothetical protein [Microthrixaceae bacterium]